MSRNDPEQRRLALQANLDAQRSAQERNHLGQFATPTALAREIAAAAVAVHGHRRIRFLEPSIGSGSFYSALLSTVPASRIAAAQGFEIDPRFATVARELWRDHGLEVVTGDFTAAVPPASDCKRATLLLANPPYVRHHHLVSEHKMGLKHRAEKLLGRKVSGLTGLYVYFVLFAHEWLAEDAVAAWLVPTEWMDVNYGAALRHYLCWKVSLLQVHRFEAADVQFRDALVSSSVVVYRRRPPEADATCQMTWGNDLGRPVSKTDVPLGHLRSALKWRPYFQADHASTNVSPNPAITLGDLLDVKRGIATGANKFFVRPRAEFLSLGLPEDVLRPVLPSSRYLLTDVIERGPDGYPHTKEPLALLDCDLREKEVMKRHPALWEYLNTPVARRIAKGYLASRRNPWYAQEQRPVAPVVVTYMGRGRNGQRPFRFFWNKSDATATNGYLLLIPKPPLAALLRRDPEKAKLIVDFLNARATAELLGHGRVYGGGLHKLEPKELARLDATGLIRDLRPVLSIPRQAALAFGD